MTCLYMHLFLVPCQFPFDSPKEEEKTMRRVGVRQKWVGGHAFMHYHACRVVAGDQKRRGMFRYFSFSFLMHGCMWVD
jgi:hypothetical protein